MLSAALAVTMAAGCGTKKNEEKAEENNTAEEGNGTDNAETEDEDNEGNNNQTADAKGAVYYLNFKPEQADQWKALAEEYTGETGVPVTIETAASGTYESTLKSEMAKKQAPTLFQVNGPAGLASWQDYCYDLKDSAVYKNLKSDDFALINDAGEVQGVAYVIETYTQIHNLKSQKNKILIWG